MTKKEMQKVVDIADSLGWVVSLEKPLHILKKQSGRTRLQY